MVMRRYLIIGSGLLGRLLAWRLIGLGHQVDILSKDNFTGSDSAGYVAASMVSPATEAIQTEPMVKTIGLVSLKLWPAWLAELPEPVFYQNNGTLVVAHPGDRTEMDRFVKRAAHVLDETDYVALTQSDLYEKEPQLAQQFDYALFFQAESSLDNRQLYRQLTTVLMASPRCNWQKCAAITSLSNTVITELAKQYFNCVADCYDQVIDCRGNGAKNDLSGLRSVRGEVMRVQAPDVDFKHAIRLIHPRYPMYLVPRPNQQYILGATVVESDDMSPISVRSGLELMSVLCTLNKSFAEARILEMASHCRPAMANNMPIIQRKDWGLQVNGLYRHGYLFSPAIITDVLALLNGQPELIQFGELFNV